MSNEIAQNPFLIVSGNAADECQNSTGRGWFIGHFVDTHQGLKKTQDIEVKWGVHEHNEQKPKCGANEEATTLTILVSGKFRLEFPEHNSVVILTRAGDYVIFAPGIAHTWRALTSSIVITVRWPSIPNDQIEPQL